jgi:hypothetical protein
VMPMVQWRRPTQELKVVLVLYLRLFLLVSDHLG